MKGTCPNCGYCPHCGRSAQPYPVMPMYPSPPWYQPIVPVWVTTPTITVGGTSTLPASTMKFNPNDIVTYTQQQ